MRKVMMVLAARLSALFVDPRPRPGARPLAEDISGAAKWIAQALKSSGYRADFTLESLREVERFFDEHVVEGQAVPGGLLSQSLGPRLFALGGYCGEVLRREVGGQWITDDSDPQGEINAALKLDNGEVCWPIQRVMKRFHGADNDVFHWAILLSQSPARDRP